LPTVAEIEAEVRAKLAAIADNPDARYQSRVQFYARYGDPKFTKSEGYGNSELAFDRWQLTRGVLKAASAGGSPWWRAVNMGLMVDSETAGALYAAGLADQATNHEVRQWLAYIRNPSSDAWYRAHNSSIIRAYLDQVDLAHAESAGEKAFLNEVLYRLLFAQALVMGKAFGAIGEAVADPKLFAVDVIVHLPALYPCNYPLTEEDVRNVMHQGRGIQADLGRVLDVDLILPHLEELYVWAGALNGIMPLVELQKDGQPTYPVIAPKPVAAAPKTREKVAILGGGMAALTAAYELTRPSDWQARYEITIYTLGWRLGGKTATGRGPNQRIEEHGIHILQGWYDNTFRLLTEVFTERAAKQLDPRSPFQAWQQAFTPNNSTLITETTGSGSWNNWTLILPPNEAVPGSGPPLSTWQILKKVTGIVFEMLLGSPYDPYTGPIAKWILSWFYPPPETSSPPDPAHQVHFDGLVDDETLPVELLKRLHGLKEQLDATSPPTNGGPYATATILEVLRGLIEYFRRQTDSPTARLRQLALAVELLWVNLKGILADVYDPQTHKMNYANVDGVDYRAWIRKHGASETAAQSSIVKFLYTGTFSNLADGTLQGGSLAAGTALQFLVRSIGYKGSFVYQFDAGTGDTMVAPIYQVLAARGVKFELFRDVQQVHWSTTGTIDAITIGEQVTLTVPVYEPLERVGDVAAWPAEPRYEQIDPAQVAKLKAGRIDLEDPWADWTPRRVRQLVRGHDFDEVILAIPVGALKECCSEIVGHDPRWAAMVTGVKTTATMSMQLWVKPTLAELGLDLAAWGLSPTDAAPNAVTYANPMYSWLDQSLVLWTERWPADDAPQTIAYFTGSMTDPAVIPPFTAHGWPEEQRRLLRATSTQWLWDNMGFFWPKATRPAAPNGFDPSLLVSWTGPNASTAEKLDAQYFRANVFPWARYTLSVPGSASFRLKTDESGFSNLFLAGDWIDFGVNVGYIEGAIVAGMQAAAAVARKLGAEARDPWLDPDTQ
jgi:uncharacterized protein with NAD-binding domain and iron-sulfur cluster